MLGLLIPIYPPLAMAIWLGQHKQAEMKILVAVFLLSTISITLSSYLLHKLVVVQAHVTPVEFCAKYNTSELSK